MGYIYIRNKISIITDISVLGIYGNIDGYFDKNIDNAKINKKYYEIHENTLLNYKKYINKQIYTC